MRHARYALPPLAALTIVAVCAPGQAGPKAVTLAGVRWEPSLKAAQARAAKEKKPILLMHLLGRLDEGFC